MSANVFPNKKGDYVEAETVSEDSEKSSLFEMPGVTVKENNYPDGLFKLRALLDNLEASFRISNSIDNGLLLKCALLEAENQTLKRNMSEESVVKLNRVYTKSHWSFPLTRRRDSSDSVDKPTDHDEAKLRDVIAELETSLREREKTIGLLCEKYLYLKSNKNRMEMDLKQKICRLERLLNLTYGILQEMQIDAETKTGQRLTSARAKASGLREAIIREKWRCDRLVHENVCLRHDAVKRLVDGSTPSQRIFIQKCGKYYEVTGHNPVDKCTSEPVMRCVGVHSGR